MSSVEELADRRAWWRKVGQYRIDWTEKRREKGGA